MGNYLWMYSVSNQFHPSFVRLINGILEKLTHTVWLFGWSPVNYDYSEERKKSSLLQSKVSSFLDFYSFSFRLHTDLRYRKPYILNTFFRMKLVFYFYLYLAAEDNVIYTWIQILFHLIEYGILLGGGLERAYSHKILFFIYFATLCSHRLYELVKTFEQYWFHLWNFLVVSTFFHISWN